LLITSKIILCGYILLAGSLVRCVACSKLGINDCFVPRAEAVIIECFMNYLEGQSVSRCS
ncbi:TPA: hypothetical protein ACX36X_004615, partial [Serratia marcescens]